MLGSRYAKAVATMLDLHKSQMRKGGKIPYVSHLMGVSALVLKAGGSEAQAISGLLHDSLEDQGDKITFDDLVREFGQEVADIVLGCTDETQETRKSVSWYDRKHAYLKQLKTNPQGARLVILADKLDNMRDMSKECLVSEGFWERFTEGYQGSTWFLSEMASVFESWGQESPLKGNEIACGMIQEFLRLLDQVKRSTN